MRVSECAREGDVLEALQASGSLEQCGADLRSHVAGCRPCAALVEIVQALTDEHHAATTEASVPPSAVVWWRAQMRARQEWTAAAMRPITIVQALTLACAPGLLAAAIGFVSPTFRSWLAAAAKAASRVQSIGLQGLAWSELQALPGAMTLGPVTIAAVVAITALALLAPLALYLSAGD